MKLPKRPDLPNRLTSYDMLKTVAVVLMVIDHLGYLMFPDQDWMRLLGRLCVPIWFFLIGYARNRDIPLTWMIGAALVDLPDAVLQFGIFPLNILFVMMFVRLLLDPFMRMVRAKPYYFWISMIILACFAPVTNMVVEYGTLGFLLALVGLYVRRPGLFRGLLGPLKADKGLVPFVFVVFFLTQTAHFKFDVVEMAVFAVLSAVVFGVLLRFKPTISQADPAQWQVQAMMFMGRYTLEIYVIHLIILKLLFAVNLYL